jgi:xanthine dehydrogenase iron-sulfur cluster and FAD-binding subunit A
MRSRDVAENSTDTARADGHDHERRPVSIVVNGQECTISVEARTTLLTALRDELGLTGTKKGCD